jgi:ATP-dependent RNA helicase DHX37/DHR1
MPDNPGMIAVTQPRRVAAVSLAVRVKSELNLPGPSAIVAHQIRYSSTTSAETAIKFMTDGVLLRELAADFLLSRYSVVVVDEAHERGVNTDVLVGVLSRVAALREKQWREGKDSKPLRIVIMSATLRVSDFANNPTLFKTTPPVIHIQARQHPVTLHFARRTVGDYVTEAYKKVGKIHARLPPGGILVFMTGQGEIQALCKKLEKQFGKKEAGAGRRIGQREKPARDELAAEGELGCTLVLLSDCCHGPQMIKG